MEINCNYVLIKRKNNYKILDSTLFPMFDSNWKNLEDFSHLNEVYYISSDGTTKYCTVIAVNHIKLLLEGTKFLLESRESNLGDQIECGTDSHDSSQVDGENFYWIDKKYPVEKTSIGKLAQIKDFSKKGLYSFFTSVVKSAFKEDERIGYNLKGSNGKKKTDGEKLSSVSRYCLAKWKDHWKRKGRDCITLELQELKTYYGNLLDRENRRHRIKMNKMQSNNSDN